MARSVKDIYDSIIAEKESFSQLNGLLPLGTSYDDLLTDLSSSSKVSVWRLMAFVVASVIWVLETFMDLWQAEVNTLIESQKFGSLPWYVSIAKLWQQGHVLIFVDDFPAYAADDPVAKIVTHASAIESGGVIFLKVAKTGGSGLEALTTPELDEFRSYIAQRKVAGANLVADSLNADTLQVDVEIKYNPILAEATVQANVELAISSYLAALPFDAVFRRLAFEDAIQGVEGVTGITINNMTGNQGLNSTSIAQEYVAGAGYMTFDIPGSTITMTPGL